LPGLGRRPLVVASLDDFAHILSDARAAAKAGANALEVRADRFPRSVLKQPELLRDVLESLRAFRRPLILTLRSRAEGGSLPVGISEMDRLSLFRAALTEAAVLDVELGADDINHHVVFEAHKRGRAVILSYHNFRATPTNAALKSLLRKAQRMKADIVKIAATPHRAKDVARLMNFCAAVPARYRVFIPMGPMGRASRLNGFSKGSCLTYGYVRRPVAPGQIAVKEILRARTVSARAGA